VRFSKTSHTLFRLSSAWKKNLKIFSREITKLYLRCFFDFNREIGSLRGAGTRARCHRRERSAAVRVIVVASRSPPPPPQPLGRIVLWHWRRDVAKSPIAPMPLHWLYCLAMSLPPDPVDTNCGRAQQNMSRYLLSSSSNGSCFSFLPPLSSVFRILIVTPRWSSFGTIGSNGILHTRLCVFADIMRCMSNLWNRGVTDRGYDFITSRASSNNLSYNLFKFIQFLKYILYIWHLCKI